MSELDVSCSPVVRYNGRGNSSCLPSGGPDLCLSDRACCFHIKDDRLVKVGSGSSRQLMALKSKNPSVSTPYLRTFPSASLISCWMTEVC
jgi:hypothetical protein